MEKFTYPLIDYRTFLSDVGTGIITLFSVIFIVFNHHPDMKSNSYVIREIHNIFSDLKINAIEHNTILIILVIILFVTPLIGFTINASSYVFLNWFLKRVSDNDFFNNLLKSIGVKNYYTIKFKPEDCKKLEKNDFNYSNFFDNVKINLRAKTGKNIVSQYDRILGGLNMCRNCTFIIIIDLCIILYIYSCILFLLVFIWSILLYFFIVKFHSSIKKYILLIFLFYLFSFPIFTFGLITIIYNFEISYILELIILTEFFLLLTIFLSAFFIVHNNHDIYNYSIIYLEGITNINDCGRVECTPKNG